MRGPHCVIAACGGLALLGGLAYGLQASGKTAAASPQLNAGLGACRVAYSELEQALRLINRAEQSEDLRQIRELMNEAKTQIAGARQQVSRCLEELESLRSDGGAAAQKQPALLEGHWVCPMHTQISQDRPGNCPICDATLKTALRTATQPVLVGLPEDTTPGGIGEIPRWTSGR